MLIVLLVKGWVCFWSVWLSVVVTKLSLWMSMPQIVCFMFCVFLLVVGRCCSLWVWCFFYVCSGFWSFCLLRGTHILFGGVIASEVHRCFFQLPWVEN
jgi:hypothetical protein